MPIFCHSFNTSNSNRSNKVIPYMRRNNSLGSNFIKYSRLNFTSSKAMNKITSNKERVFIPLNGPSGSGKLHLIFDELKTGSFQSKLDKFSYLYQHYQPLYGQMLEKTLNFSKELILN